MKDVRLHLSRTETWAENLGKWRCHVQGVEAHGEEKDTLQAILIIYLPRKGSFEVANDDGEDASQTTWKCVRKIPEFHHFHRELVPYVAWVKTLDLPSSGSKSIFGRPVGSSRQSLERARELVQRYLDCVLQDEQLNQSEIVYAFLSPTPSHLKSYYHQHQQLSPHIKRNYAPFSSFFRSSAADSSGANAGERAKRPPPRLSQGGVGCSGGAAVSSVEPCEPGSGGGGACCIMDELDDTDCDPQQQLQDASESRDVIAESVYGLVGEVFDMRGVFKWMRKSLMTFVQITYGSTINRQIRDTVAWVTSEQMTLFYLHAFRKAFWHADQDKVGLGTGPCEEQRERIRAETREALLQTIPEMLMNLVGQQAATNGTVKVFETLQNVTLNKQLFYAILEHCMYELFPELLESHAAHQFKSYSLELA